MKRLVLAVLACAVVTVFAVPSFATDTGSDPNLKTSEGVKQLFDTLRDNSGGGE